MKIRRRIQVLSKMQYLFLIIERGGTRLIKNLDEQKKKSLWSWVCIFLTLQKKPKKTKKQKHKTSPPSACADSELEKNSGCWGWGWVGDNHVCGGGLSEAYM